MLSLRADASGFVRGVQNLERAVLQAANLALRAGVAATEVSAAQTALYRDRTGETRASVRGVVEGFRGGLVRFGGASSLLDSGTRPHLIVGNPVLRFERAGQVFYRRFVRHPGTQPRPFVREAREAGELALEAAARGLVNSAIRSTH